MWNNGINTYHWLLVWGSLGGGILCRCCLKVTIEALLEHNQSQTPHNRMLFKRHLFLLPLSFHMWFHLGRCNRRQVYWKPRGWGLMMGWGWYYWTTLFMWASRYHWEVECNVADICCLCHWPCSEFPWFMSKSCIKQCWSFFRFLRSAPFTCIIWLHLRINSPHFHWHSRLGWSVGNSTR